MIHKEQLGKTLEPLDVFAHLTRDFVPPFLDGGSIRLPFGSLVIPRRLRTLEKPSAPQGEMQLGNGQQSRERRVHVHEVLQLERLASVDR
ncbi:hypothetical protein ACFRIB_19450 [Streptomyces mirabilis]|uniref:hypothetical protein n=1 Tax=Streptomyces mirabilis TaxID=68239 RepID=UPI0036892E5D